MRGLSERVRVPEDLLSKALELGKHYIAARHPNAHAEGPPFQHYTEAEAERAIAHAEAILRFCRDHLA